MSTDPRPDTGPPADPSAGGEELARREDRQPSPLRQAARSTGNAVAVVAHEVRNAPARGWLLAERVAALAARAGDTRVVLSDVIQALWDMAENSEANVLHVVNGPLGPERTNMRLSPKKLRAQFEGARGEASQAGATGESETHFAADGGAEQSGEDAADAGPRVRMQTGGMLSSDEAVMVELDVPERHLDAVVAKLEAMGLATEELGRQLRGLPSHALPLRGGKRR